MCNVVREDLRYECVKPADLCLPEIYIAPNAIILQGLSAKIREENMKGNLVHDEEESRRTELAYHSPEIVRQRERTLDVLAAVSGERIVDVGCGPGLLAHDIAAAVGDTGRVIGIDPSTAMLDLAEKRCAALGNVELLEGGATCLALPDNSVDAICCTQVLLYVADSAKALSEMHRVLKPGGRVLVLETDWRSTVLHSNDEELTEKIIEAWDKVVPSPRLPARLGKALRAAGFGSVQVCALPIISTDSNAGGFSMSMMDQCAESACEQGTISPLQREAWLSELTQLGADNEYFFCVNRFIFTGFKPE